MTRLLRVALGFGSCAAILTTSGALAAYASPRLEATQSGNTVTIDASQSAGDDATAIVRIISPLGTAIAASRPAGTALGTASATFVATAASGGELTAEGRVEVVSAGPVAPQSLSGCAEGERVEGVWSLRFATGVLTASMPLYVLVGGDLLLCVPHPSSLTQGAKLVGLKLTLTAGLELRPAGTWISIWVPYGATEADLSRAVASPAVVGAGTVEFTARTKGRGATLLGIVRQAGAPRAGARVRITGSRRAVGGSVLGTATTNGVGRFTFRAKSGTFFRATASVGRSSPPGICFVLEPFLRPIPCVNPTMNGFSVQSRTIRKS
ncbi:MAG: hypothetical protein ACRDPX_11820 [Gaiellaceae bacterium]